MLISTPNDKITNIDTILLKPKGKDTNRKIRKCGVHRLYAKLFSSIDVYIP